MMASSGRRMAAAPASNWTQISFRSRQPKNATPALSNTERVSAVSLLVGARNSTRCSSPVPLDSVTTLPLLLVKH